MRAALLALCESMPSSAPVLWLSTVAYDDRSASPTPVDVSRGATNGATNGASDDESDTYPMGNTDTATATATTRANATMEVSFSENSSVLYAEDERLQVRNSVASFK